MSLSPSDLEKVLDLANLEINPDQSTEYLVQLQNILDYMNVLNELDLTSTPPTKFMEENMVLRPDLVKKTKIDISTFAPVIENGGFQVPKIL